MSPLKVSFALKWLKCKMNEAIDECYKAFNTVIKKIGSRDLIQEVVAYNIYPTRTWWKLSKEVKSKEEELVTLAFDFKEQSSYKAPSAGRHKLIEKCNEMRENYLVREHEDMKSIFGN
jgi:N-glycosylase/DNA lyase